MHRNRRPFKLIPIFILFLVILVYLAHTYPPNWKLEIWNLPAGRQVWKLEILYPFFLFFFLFLSTFFAFFLNHIRRGFFFGLLLTSYFFTRYLGLHHPFFALTLIAIFLALELVFSRNRQ